MKKLVAISAILLFAGIAYGQNKADIEKEKEAIMVVLQEEGNAHAEHDLEGLQKAYINDSLTVRVHTREKNYSILEGWDQVNSLFEGWLNMDMSKYNNIEHLKEMGVKVELFNPEVKNPEKFYNFDVAGESTDFKHAVKITGPTNLKPGEFDVKDLRHGATLTIAAIIAQGKSKLNNVGQIDRGYEELDTRLRSMGAKIERVESNFQT